MKKRLLFLLYIATLFQCKVETTDFEVNAEIWGSFGAINRLIVTNRCGEIVKIFDNPAETFKIQETFPYKSRNPEDQTLDFHWIIGDTSGDYVSVVSSLGVHSGDYVLMRAGATSNNYSPETRTVVVLVDGIPAQTSGWDFEVPGVSSWNQNIPNNGQLGLQFEMDKSQHLYLRAKPSNNQHWSEYFVPDSLIQDTIYASVTEFKPANPFTLFESEVLVGRLEMTELSTDLTRFTVLKTTSNGSSLTAQPGFILPPGHTLPATFRLRASANLATGSWAMDKILPLGAPLRIEKPDMSIIDKLVKPGEEIGVFVAGHPDGIRVSTYNNQDGKFFGWQIEGRPEYFLSYKLPDILAYFPPWVDKQIVFDNLFVVAFRFDQLDYEQYRAGFPDRSEEQYAYAKSGMLMIWK